MPIPVAKRKKLKAITFDTEIIKIGNSQGIIISKTDIDYLKIKIGDIVEITLRKINNSKQKED